MKSNFWSLPVAKVYLVGLFTFNRFHCTKSKQFFISPVYLLCELQPPQKVRWFCNRAHLFPTTHEQYITWVLTPERLKNYNQTFQRYRIIDCWRGKPNVSKCYFKEKSHEPAEVAT